jgi:hypothetical protein
VSTVKHPLRSVRVFNSSLDIVEGLSEERSGSGFNLSSIKGEGDVGID